MIDWFTVGAQGINFLILVWLLKRFLFKPIVTAIDTREKRIADQIAQAEAKQAEAQKELDEYKRLKDEFDLERETLMAGAVEEARSERKRLIDEARTEFEALRGQQSDALARQREDVAGQIVARTSEEVFAIVRKTLCDLASASLEERMADVLVARLEAMSAKERSELAVALTASPAEIVVRSAFALPVAQQQFIEAAIDRALGGGRPVRFETSADLISGIELVTDGYKVCWNIADYLDALKAIVAETIKDEHGSRPIAR